MQSIVGLAECAYMVFKPWEGMSAWPTPVAKVSISLGTYAIQSECLATTHGKFKERAEKKVLPVLGLYHVCACKHGLLECPERHAHTSLQGKHVCITLELHMKHAHLCDSTSMNAC